MSGGKTLFDRIEAEKKAAVEGPKVPVRNEKKAGVDGPKVPVRNAEEERADLSRGTRPQCFVSGGSGLRNPGCSTNGITGQTLPRTPSFCRIARKIPVILMGNLANIDAGAAACLPSPTKSLPAS
jgi:hypothetical protein